MNHDQLTVEEIRKLPEHEKAVLRINVNRTLSKIASAQNQIEAGIREGDVK